MSGQMIARIPFRYNGQELERGQLVSLIGSARDDQLTALGYFIPFDKREHHELPCDMCSRRFISDGFYTAHKRKGCLAKSPAITKTETAELLGKDPKDVRVED